MLSSADLPQIIELLAIGFAVGVGGGGAAFVIALIVNTFYDVANG